MGRVRRKRKSIAMVILAIQFTIFVSGSVFFIAVMAYGYWILSIGMALVLWILMSIGVIVGLVGALKNAFKAAGDIQGKGVN